MMAENAPAVSVEKIFSTAYDLPYCKIDREEFLTKELKNRVSPLQLADALENGTINAKIPINILDDIARGAIALETSKVTLISTAAGIPGGFAMIGTVPTDLAQFYAHVFRIAQKLAYIRFERDRVERRHSKRANALSWYDVRSECGKCGFGETCCCERC